MVQEKVVVWFVADQDKAWRVYQKDRQKFDNHVIRYRETSCELPVAYPSTWLECHSVVPSWR
jgi:hypothetical protein